MSKLINIFVALLLTFSLACGPADMTSAEGDVPSEQVTITFDIPQGDFNRPIDIKIFPNIISKGRGTSFNVSSPNGPLFLGEGTNYYETIGVYNVTDEGVKQIMATISKNLDFFYKSYAIPELIIKEADGSLQVKIKWGETNGLGLYFLAYKAGAPPTKISGNFFALSN